MNVLYVSLLLYLLNNFCVKSESIIKGVQEALNGVSNLIDDISYGIKQIRDGLTVVDDIVKYAQGAPCEYKCPPGLKLKKNHHHKSTPQGCGAYGIQLVLSHPLLKDTDKCCDKHDICYDTCKSVKSECDAELGRCLYRKCEKQAKKLGDDVRMTALHSAKTGCNLATRQRVKLAKLLQGKNPAQPLYVCNSATKLISAVESTL